MAKHAKQKAPKGRNAPPASDAITDPRFTNIHTDPRFRLPSKKHSRVQLDDRFAHVLKDEEFSRKATVDKYGRKLASGTGRKELERFYRVNEDEAEAEAENGEDGGSEIDDDEEVARELRRVDRSYDPARGGGFSSSEDSSDEEEEEEAVVAEEAHFPDTQIEPSADVPMGEVSSRLAVVNLDWDNIRAVDLMAVFSSFCPSHGRIRKVSVYPSEFGRERMEREEMDGPPREIFTSNRAAPRRGGPADDEEDEDGMDGEDGEEEDEHIKDSLLREDKGEEFDSAKLRHYQLERLRYYYAVITLSSKETAKALYDATDGTEYLTTANFFDLRFIPDDVSFDDDRPRDECTQIPHGYKPNSFVTDALQHSKVKLTWDADDGVRKEVVKKAFSGSRADIEENDLKAYLASDSSDDDGGDDETNGIIDQAGSLGDDVEKAKVSKKEAERVRLRAALGLSDTPASSESRKAPGGPVGDMQITFTSGLSSTDKAQGSSVFTNEPIIEETTVEKYVRRERERKARRKEKLKATRNGDEPPASTTADAPSTPANGAEATGSDDNNTTDLGFADPFFTAPDASSTSKPPKAITKAERLALRAARTAAVAASADEKAELALLLAPDPSLDPSSSHDPPLAQGEHFSLPSILAAEHALQKAQSAKSKKHLSTTKKRLLADMQAGKAAEAGLQPGFKMDVRDPRFEMVYQGGSEWAVDPGSKRWTGSGGMREVLEEGRRRRGEREREGEGKPTVKRAAHDQGDVDVGRLVEKVKRRKVGA